MWEMTACWERMEGHSESEMADIGQQPHLTSPPPPADRQLGAYSENVLMGHLTEKFGHAHVGMCDARYSLPIFQQYPASTNSTVGERPRKERSCRIEESQRVRRKHRLERTASSARLSPKYLCDLSMLIAVPDTLKIKGRSPAELVDDSVESE